MGGDKMFDSEKSFDDTKAFILIFGILLAGAFFFVPFMILIILLTLAVLAFALVKELLQYLKHRIFNLLGLKEDHFKAWYDQE